jgi:hypothetical protein
VFSSVAAIKAATLFYYTLNAQNPPPVIYVPEGAATCGIAIYVLESTSNTNKVLYLCLKML